MTGPKKIALGADHGGFDLKTVLAAHLRKAGHRVEDVGTSSREAVDYPVFARAVADAVSQGRADVGIIIDGAGIGSCMVANKVPGVRAALAGAGDRCHCVGDLCAGRVLRGCDLRGG